LLANYGYFAFFDKLVNIQTFLVILMSLFALRNSIKFSLVIGHRGLKQALFQMDRKTKDTGGTSYYLQMHLQPWQLKSKVPGCPDTWMGQCCNMVPKIYGF